MDLGTDDEGVSLLGFPRHTVEGKILVTNAYNEMFDRILEFRGGMGKTEGVVLTGQPGIGTCLSFYCSDHHPLLILRQENPYS